MSKNFDCFRKRLEETCRELDVSVGVFVKNVIEDVFGYSFVEGSSLKYMTVYDFGKCNCVCYELYGKYDELLYVFLRAIGKSLDYSVMMCRLKGLF